MRFIWTDQGDDPSWGVGDAHAINGYFMPMFDALTTKAFLRDQVQARGHVAGIYAGHGWFPGKSAAQIAKAVSDEYKRCLVSGLRVMFNMEEHDPEHIANTLEAWRLLHPTVPTSWSCEPMQGGWMNPEFVERVLTCRVRVVPQTFWGDMRGVAPDQVLRDLLRRGFPEHVVSCFYDAAKVHDLDRADGYFFTMGRLP